MIVQLDERHNDARQPDANSPGKEETFEYILYKVLISYQSLPQVRYNFGDHGEKSKQTAADSCT